MKLFIAGFLLFLLAACQGQETGRDKKPENTDGRLKYAVNFKLIPHGDYTELQILDPEKGRIEQKYALVNRNKHVTFPQDLVKIEVPVKSVIALSGTHIGMIEKLHCADRISGISSKNYVANKTVLKGYAAGKVLEFDDFGQLNPESVLKTPARIIVYSGFGKTPQNEDKLSKLGILCLPDYDWRETHPLGKAEWIKLFGYLFGKEKEASAYFAKVEQEYLQLKETVADLKDRPTVFSGSMIGDSWYMPAGESYGAVLLKDANADYTASHEKGTGSVSYSFEQVLKADQESIYWFNPGFSTKAQLLSANAKYQYFEAFKDNNVYCYSHDMNGFWENSAIEPNHVLSDLIQVLHKGKVEKSKLYFYKQLK